MAMIPPSHMRAPYRRPTILIGSGTTLLGRPVISIPRAANAGMYGMDLDLRQAWNAPSVDEIRSPSTTRIRSVWLPARYSGMFSEKRLSRLRALLDYAALHCGLRTIVMPKAILTGSHSAPLAAMAQELARWHRLRLAVRVSADSLLQQAGSHLAHVANMRRLAEEWELGIALDLTSPRLEQWEAEAALMRLFPRLELVRVRPWHDAEGVHLQTPEARAGLRSVMMLADQAYSDIISIAPVPATPRWLASLGHPNLRPAIIDREEILAAYDRIGHYHPPFRQARHPDW